MSKERPEGRKAARRGQANGAVREGRATSKRNRQERGAWVGGGGSAESPGKAWGQTAARDRVRRPERGIRGSHNVRADG